MKPAEFWIEQLGLIPHPEGGFFKETYRAEDTVAKAGLPDRFPADRSASTGIYFLLRSQDFSHLHRIESDEMWHFYAGTSLTVHMLDEAGNYSTHKIGADPENGAVFQAVVPAGVWFGATVDDPNSYALVGCTVAPGFDFAGFEMAERDKLMAQFPEHAEIIKRITK